MNCTLPPTQGTPDQHQSNTLPPSNGNPKLTNSERQSNTTATKVSGWDRWNQQRLSTMTEQEIQQEKCTWSWGDKPPPKCTIIQLSKTQPGTFDVLQYGDRIVEDTTGKFTAECEHINAHPQDFYAYFQSEFNKDE